MSDRTEMPASYDDDISREPDSAVEVRPHRTEVAVLHLEPGTVARARTWEGERWEYREYTSHFDDLPLIALIPGDREGLGWGARVVFHGGLAGIRNGHHERDRAVWHEAAKAIRNGGVAYVEHEQQDWHGKQVWVAVRVRSEGCDEDE